MLGKVFRRVIGGPGGFTLLELLVVILVLGILLAVAVPSFFGRLNPAHDSAPQQYVAISYKSAKSVFWRMSGSYQPLGSNTETSGTQTLLGQLKYSEPQLTFSSTSTSSADPKVVAVAAPSPDIAAYAATSKTGTTFCEETIERQVGTFAPGVYLSKGTGTAPCGQPAAAADYLAGNVPSNVNDVPSGSAGVGGSTGGAVDGVWNNTPTSLPVPVYIGDSSTPQVFQQTPGMVVLSGLTAGNSSTISGAIAANGQVTVGNSSSISSINLGPSAPPPNIGNSGSVDSITRRAANQGPWILNEINTGQSATQNDNSTIPTGNGVTYDATTRSLSLGNSASLTLQSGTYNLCSLSLANSDTITIPADATVKIYVDSPDDPGSGCPAGSGNLILAGNSATFNNLGPAINLTLFFYGYDDGSQVIDFKNSTYFKGALVAPQSSVNFKNSATIVGGIAAASLTVKNSLSFTWDSSVSGLTMG